MLAGCRLAPYRASDAEVMRTCREKKTLCQVMSTTFTKTMSGAERQNSIRKNATLLEPKIKIDGYLSPEVKGN
jgi:hypothetical protein